MIPRSSRHWNWSYAVLPAALSVFLFSCSSSSGGGGPPAVTPEVEPNDVFTDADVAELKNNKAGSGSLSTETDIDFWSLKLTEGDVIEVELFATRLDQAAWDTGDSIPRITIYDTDGSTVLVHHDYTNLWSWGKHDLDHPMLRVPASGTYFASVTIDGAAVVDGAYCIRVTKLNVGTIQDETDETLLGNDTFDTAEPIVPGTVYGFHDDNDSDWYSFEITSPSVVRFELVTYRNGVIADDSDYFDPELTLYDVDGTTSLFDDDDAFFYDSAIDYLIKTPGIYFLQVAECCGDGDAPYFLTYSRKNAGGANENEPNDAVENADSISYGGSINGNVGDLASIPPDELDGFKFNGTKGDMVRVQIFDASNSLGKADFAFFSIYAGSDLATPLNTGGDFELRTSTTILQETGPHFIVVEPFGVQTDYRIELTRFQSSTYESEPNDTTAQADSLGTRASGVIEVPAPGVVIDVDLFKFSASKDRLTTISIYASNINTELNGSDGFYNFSGHGSSLQPTLRILDSAGAEIAISPGDWVSVDTEDVINGLPCGAVSFISTTGGTHYVEVTDALDSSGSDFYYVIEKSD